MRAKLGWVAAVAAVAVALPGVSAARPAQAPAPRPSWQAFKADRVEFLETLAPAFVSCFKRHDSLIDPLSPIFHGCLDWHSAVHAAYSHHVLHRRTGDETYLKLIEDQFAPQGVSLIPLEEAYEKAKAPEYPLTENPYGFGWFLVLARERETSLGLKDLRPMADFAAQQMVSWFETRLSTGDVDTYVFTETHANYSWSLMNLDLWARFTGDKELAKAVTAAAEPLRSKTVDARCDLATEVTRATGFQSPCLMRLAALAQIYGSKAKGFITDRLPTGLQIAPVEKPPSCHAGGLNFTRAFALWKLYQLTGNTDYRDNYTELIRFHVAHPELYIGESYVQEPDYMCYSHWVAQMGVRAISLSYEAPAP
jgi:hypothetical protein